MTGQSLLSVRDLTIRIGQAGQPVVDGLSFDVQPGEILSIIGESGSGKTMAARAILDLLPPGLNRTNGEIWFESNQISGQSAARMQALRGCDIGMVFQEPMVSLNPAMTIGRQLNEGLALHTDLSRAARHDKIITMLERVQIPDPEGCLRVYPHAFSGGMRQRIMLASVMLLEPKLLIADEPTTALDTITQREVLDLMVGLSRDVGTAVILITHNLGLVARYSSNMIVMRQGKKVESGPTRQVLQHPQHGYTQELVAAVIRPDKDLAIAKPEVIFEARNLDIAYPQPAKFLFRVPPKTVVRDVSLKIHRGETLAVVGGSGSGKTTLGRALLRLMPSAAGQILFNGQDITTSKDLGAFRLGCQLVFQDPYSSLNPRIRVGDIVAEPLRHLPDLPATRKQQMVTDIMAEVGLSDFLQRFPHELSGGQRQRVAIARALIRKPDFVVADEPVSALDMTIQRQVIALFRDLQKRHGFACLMISHDLATVQEIAHRVIVMEQGRIVEQGETAAVFGDPQHEYTRALIEASPEMYLQSLISPTSDSLEGQNLHG